MPSSNELDQAAERLRRVYVDGETLESVYGDDVDCFETDKDIVLSAYLARQRGERELVPGSQPVNGANCIDRTGDGESGGQSKKGTEMTKNGIALISEERQRQISQEGWTTKHDDQHACGELMSAARSYLGAASYARLNRHTRLDMRAPRSWPWETEWWKPSDDPIRNLVKAGALIAAEIDRLQRRASQ